MAIIYRETTAHLVLAFSSYTLHSLDGSNSAQYWQALVKRPNVMVIDDKNLGRNCNCKYDKLYSTVGGKPLLGCFPRTFTVSAISNTRDHRSSTDQVHFLCSFSLFFPSFGAGSSPLPN